ncbi:peptide-methionine (S)-S-oxide reductase [Maribacter confluentis]|uniref:peptide-methionine (S)-S-oxide reductase n=1 Tax=Maribacter confluentis TaxID=1656093 RepID=A0ABT8RKF7_9FLAO|nr:peptide-methionine (S)-S-oxide reductase [Maribacter confluentis]MDO1511465.1 peptide-methionine (S)-S-oxide reductase [Maribacter confluentis]
MDDLDTIRFGGGCHWCTEAVFMALKGVVKVEQGFIAPLENMGNFSEAVIVHYSPEIIDLKDLVAIHLDTHRSTNNHSMRNKYRSAIYYFKKNDKPVLLKIMSELQQDFNAPLITDILSFGTFKSSEEQFQNYYFSDIDKPFCKTHIAPKIKLLKEKYVQHVSTRVT